ncbi:MAG: peptidylprolyl isomerase [Candidatus Aminicenantaceae bacterium]
MKRSRWIISLILMVSCGLILAGNEVIEEIVAVVNEDIITRSDYIKRRQDTYQSLQTRFEGDELEKRFDSLQEELLDGMITELLLLQEAERKGFSVTEQVKMGIERLKEDNGFETDEELKRALAQQGLTYEEFITEMEKSYLKENVIVEEVNRSIVIEDSETVNYYKNHPKEFTEPTEYKIKAIYLSEGDKTEDEINSLKNEINEKLASGEPLASLAEKYSEGPGKESKGDLGTFVKGEMESRLEEAVEKIEVGELTQWIKVKNGWFLLRLVDKKESHLKPYEEVSESIGKKLFDQKSQEKYKEYIDELKNKSYIKIINPNPIEHQNLS